MKDQRILVTLSEILFNKKKHIVNKEIIDLTNENVVIKVIENNKITI